MPSEIDPKNVCSFIYLFEFSGYSKLNTMLKTSPNQLQVPQMETVSLVFFVSLGTNAMPINDNNRPQQMLSTYRLLSECLLT